MDEKFLDTVTLVIDNLEGGYYHPQMLKDGRVKDTRYSSSGETMFGIDRKAGGSINTTPAGKEFWGVIDNAGASKSWKWNYKGGNLGGKLKELAAKIIYPEYIRMSNRYLSPEARKIVDSDRRLLFNFIYATWNGEGWFERFAKPINAAVKNGVTDVDALTKIAVERRTSSTNSLIAQGGRKISDLLGLIKSEIKSDVKQVADSVSAGLDVARRSPALLIMGTTLILGSIYFYYKYKQQQHGENI
jgi:hypothetical protein